jgi:serine/threonine protein phosphatase PrpC
MASNSPEPTPARAGGWLARLKGMVPALNAGEPNGPAPTPADQEAPTAGWAAPEPALPPVVAPATEEVPVAEPVENAVPGSDCPVGEAEIPVAAPVEDSVPLALPVDEETIAPPAPEERPEKPLDAADETGEWEPAVPREMTEAAPPGPAAAEAIAAEAVQAVAGAEAVAAETVFLPLPTPREIHCPVCQAPRVGLQDSCADCGFYFSAADLAAPGTTASNRTDPAVRLQDRFELRDLIVERDGVARFRGFDHGDGKGPPVPVIIVRQFLVPDTLAATEAPKSDDSSEEILPGFDDAVASLSPITQVLPARPAWPSIEWERGVLRTLEQPALPALLASFTEAGHVYLVEEVPVGRPFWDAWDDPESTSEQRFGWLIQIAEGLASLHHCNAMLEAVRPDLIVVTESGQARLTEVTELLPLPLPQGAPVRGTLYTAPELIAGGPADARAGLYSFGAMLYALHVCRELQEIDFDRPGYPKPFIPRFPDIHPAFGRLISKTFRREIPARFPTDEAGKEDPTGFVELIRTLNVLRRTLDNVRLEIASWTTTGMVRTGNEDGYALIHTCESRQDDVGEQALVLLCDGMGGYEAGEVAAALAIQVLRQFLLYQKPFAALMGKSPFPTDVLTGMGKTEGHAGPSLDVEVCKQLLKSALKEANKQVFAASRAPGSRRRGMGCTAEVVYIDGCNVVVGHVGDSRTYHLSEGRIIQLTRDQTLVNRLVELGTLTPEEAETHPRRNELQQAIGGQPDVEPGVSSGKLKPGDWVLVCSDGLTNHVSALMLKEMLLSEAQSAEMAARRLVNLANIEGATDNSTVVVIRAT